MATQTTVTITCDICGSAKDATTRRIGLDGQALEIDLCGKDTKAFDKVAQRYVPHARRVKQGNVATGRRTLSARQHSSAVREWAKTQGLQVSARGRIPASVEAQYSAAH